MENNDVTEIEIRDAIYAHVCQLSIAGLRAKQAFRLAVQTYEHAYGTEINFRDQLLKSLADED